jgi:S-adenosylmethionine:tRNA ribosyltransferase-isomerase
VKTSLFDYELPEAAIAQHPLADRDASRLLVLGLGEVRHATFREWPELVPEGALVVLNDTRVINARVLGNRRGSGGRVELLLTRKVEERSPDEELWLSIGRASRSLKVGTIVDSGPLSAEVVSREDEGVLVVRLAASGGVSRALAAHGHVPLPPYMRRPDAPDDVERYQTVFARQEGSIAAPTAGLHVTAATLSRLAARGVEVAFTTLHVGIGTFRPVAADDLDDHAMHVEELVVSEELSRAVARARERARPVVAVGTTVVRALESARDPHDARRVVATSGPTQLLIQPGYSFGPVDALLTNFHMPKSTLLALVSAFAGRGRVLDAYRTALDAGYRFLSYGDAMWIPERAS